MDYNVKEPVLLPILPQDIPTLSDRGEKIELILSNTAQENAFWWISYGENRLKTWEKAETLLKKRLKTFLGKENENLLSDIKKKYNFGVDGKSWGPQKFWDTLTTDIRATCPMNELTETLNTSPHLTVHRLYIEHSPSSTLDKGADWGAWHGWDTETMFGFKYFRGAEKGYETTTEHDWQLAEQLRTLTSQFARGETQGWSPSDTIYLVNDTPWRESRSTRPQSDLCAFWKENDLDGWGWQN
jgi:hypothetical protein